MKILYYDLFCGISGDMNLGALIDLGVDSSYLIDELSKLNLDNEYNIEVTKEIKKGINGTRFKVDLSIHHEHGHHEHGHHEHGQHEHGHHEHGQHEHGHHEHGHHEHGHHEHGHHEHGHHEHGQYEHEHEHQRNIKDIALIINNSSLSPVVKKMSMEMFMRIAQAEATVHGKSINDVHFHEVGAIDSIVDIVGTAIAIDFLNVDKIMASTVQLGGGFVVCAHGKIPVPAPATVEILKGIPVRTGLVSFETTTPTGAAILAANVSEFSDKTDFVIEKTGYGIGTRDLDVPNVLRVYLAKSSDGSVSEEQCIIETNIDDMNPEFYGFIEDRLFEAGAVDVFKTQIIMKKGRPAVQLSILVEAKSERPVLDVLFAETTSLGVRKFSVEKMMLERRIEKIETPLGTVGVKKSYYQGELVKSKIEFEDCRRIAAEKKVPLMRIYKDIEKLI